MAMATRYSEEFRARAVRLVHEASKEHPSEWSAMKSIASKVGCNIETLRKWVRHAQSSGSSSKASSPESRRIDELEREVRELKRANEILRKASAYFAQAELDRLPR